MKLTPKRQGYGLELKTFEGGSGVVYMFMRLDVGFHVFAEVEAARDGGSRLEEEYEDANARMM